MHKTYAGILGFLGFSAVALHGAASGGSAEVVLWRAWISLIACGTAGSIVGRIAAWTIEESIRQQFAEKLRQHLDAEKDSAETMAVPEA